MADKKFNLDFYAKVQTDVGSVKEVIKNLKAQLENLKLPAGATKNFERTFTNLEKSIQDFESVASNGITSLADTKKIDNAWKKITGLFSTLGIQIKDLNSISDQIFPKEVSANISKATKALGEYQAKIEAIKKSQSYTEKSSAKAEADSKAKTAANEWQKQQDILDRKQREYDAKQNAWNQNRAAQYQDQKDQISKITQEIEAQNAKLQEQKEIQKQLRDAGVTTKEGTVRESHKRAITSVEADIAGMEKAQKLAKENLELAKKTEAQTKKAQASAKGQETKILKKIDAKDPKAIAATQAKTAAMQAYAQAQSEVATKTQELADIEANLAKAKDRLSTLQEQSAQAEQVGKRIQDIEDEIEVLDKTREATKKAAAANAEYETKLNESKEALEDQKVVVASYETAMNEAKNAANSLGAEMNQMELDQAKTEWEALVKVIKEFTGIDLTAAQGNIQEITRILEEYKVDQIKKAPETIENLGEAARQAEPQLENTKKAVDEVTESVTNMTRTERDIENLKDQILDFFSISNTVQIFKDAVRIAFETVKELDAVMTETAVVTDFSVGDMWDKLPEYSDEANKLGTSISSLYEATTLYYQQGLKSQEAMDVGIETMKMARIANMDAAAATEAMTAALRGFNMEINETSATRINDVYSELAAITAADTSQIATAMSKTASIASSANMEFETTAALLAQIIETTQEAPETAGTAMKTIIARFTEVKQLFDEGMLTGKDSEGEEININKIDAALKKVGISLSDFLKGKKGIDEIFLDLASKWEGLDLATQRYIATTAAGSRQQSRFLAMMSNYGRTMELVTAANNSAGASQKQFDKTLESLDAKIQRLKNAWAEFTMGLANNELIKGAVDLLTLLLEKLNEMTDFGSDGFGGVVTMLARLGTVLAGLKGGEVIINSILKSLLNGKKLGQILNIGELTSIGDLFKKKEDPGLLSALFTRWKFKKGMIAPGTEEIQQAGNAILKATNGFKEAKVEVLAFGKSLLSLAPYIAILIGIGAAVYGVVKSFQAAQKEAKLNEVNNSIEQLNSELTNTQEEFKEITNSRSDLENLNNTLNELTRGTIEWKSALIDVNQQVLELADKYPELKVITGKYGELQIAEDSWDELLAKQQKVITNMNAQRIVLQSQAKELTKGIDFENFVIQTAQIGAKNTKVDWAAVANNMQLASDISQGIYDLSTSPEFFEITIEDPEYTQKEKEQVERQIRAGNWLDENSWIMAALAASNDSMAYDSPAAQLGAEFGAQLAKALGIENATATPNMDLHNKTVEEGGYLQQTYKNLIDMTEDQYIKVAEYFADNTMSTNSEERAIQIANAFERAGIVDDEDGTLLKRFESILTEADNEFYNLVEAIHENTIAEQRLTHQFVTNALTGTTVMDKEYGDAIANIISKGQDATLNDQIDSMVETVRESYKNDYGKLDSTAIAKEYAEIMGYQEAGGIVYTDGTYSQKVETEIEGMLRAIATYKVTEGIQQNAKNASDFLAEKQQSQQELFDSLFTSEGAEITVAQINKYQKEDGIVDFDLIQRDLGLTFEELATKLKPLGIDVKNIEETLTDNLILATERIAKQRADIAKRMAKYSNKDSEQNANDLAGLEGKFGEWIRATLENTLSSLERTGDEKIVSKGLEYFRNVALSGTEEEVQNLSNLISEIDWSNPIEAANRLNREIESGSNLAKGFAYTIKSSDSQFLGAESQFSTLLGSGLYTDLENSLSKIYETQGKITETDIRSLASEYSQLNKMMKNTSVTGKGLADILTSIEKGELSFDAVTDAVIAAVGQMDSLGEATDKVLEKLEQFDLGKDTGMVQDKYAEFAEKTKEWQEKGQYGNEQYENLLNYQFGDDWDVGYEDDLIGRMQELSEISQKLGEDMYYAWDNASQGLDIYGNKISNNAINKLQELGIILDNVDGQVVFDIPDDMTFDEITTILSETFGASKEMWDDLITYFESRDPNFRRSWIAADYNTMGQRIVESETTRIGDKKVVTEKEISDIASVQAGKTDKTVEVITQDIKDQLSGFTEEIIIIPKLEGLNAEEITRELDIAFGGFAEQFKVSLENGVSGLDLSSMLNSLIELGISSEIATQIANGAAVGAAAAGETVIAMVDGQQIIIPVTADTEDAVALMTETINGAKEKAESTPIEQTAAVTVDQGQWRVSVNEARKYLIKTLSGISVPVTAYVANAQVTSQNNNKKSAGNKFSQVYMKAEKGTQSHPRDELALTGEEGPELVETKDGAYLVGTEGPQMANIHRGDTVHTAKETKEIYKRRGLKVPAFKGGNMGPVSGISGGSGGASSDNDEDTWENPFDKLYNLVRKIDEELRQRERIERRYEKLLESLNVSANKIISVSREELAQLERERMLQEQLIEGRKYQIDKYQQENADLMKYADVTQNERGEDVLRINWDLIDQVTDTEEGERIEEYVSQLEEWFDNLEEAEDALWDIEDAVAEIKERGKEEYFELEDAIKEALAQSYQEEIDKLSQINESINNTNSSLIEAIQKSIDKQRQDRDNQRTEEDIAEKQRRLAYLQQDTSGANDLEILRLQEEISQEQEDYTDTLIDQKISELQQQNDEAAKQREQQITLAQAQLDHFIESGQIWEEVYNLINAGLDKDSGLVRGSRLEEILRNSENFSGMSEIGKMEWLNETNNMIAQALAYLEIGRQLEDIGIKSGTQIEFVNKNGERLTGTVDEKGNVVTSDGKTYNNVYQGADGKFYSDENIPETEKPVVETPKRPVTQTSKPGSSAETSKSDSSTETNKPTNPVSQKKQYWKVSYTVDGSTKTLVGYSDKATAESAARSAIYSYFQGKGYYGGTLEESAGWARNTIKAESYYAYKKGGLADFTGPAWLDGTKARPELVLNARDTANFIQLKDILDAIMNRNFLGTSTATENNGDINYDIDINVETIGSDYDVEQVANKVKSMISENGRYRNNNAISLKR